MRTQRIKLARRKRRSQSVRAKLKRTAVLPRLSVCRTLKHISAQVIDDKSGRTLASVTSTGKGIGSSLEGKTKTERAAYIGSEIGRIAKEAGIDQVVFDRGGSRYHGRVKALADGAREAGLKF